MQAELNGKNRWPEMLFPSLDVTGELTDLEGDNVTERRENTCCYHHYQSSGDRILRKFETSFVS